MTALVVEDEAIIRKYLVLVLSNLGISCVGEADTAEDAVRLAAELRPDVVLMDIKLRGWIDGISAAGQIGRDLSLPVLLMSAYDFEESALMGSCPGVMGFLAKPVTPEMVKEAIATLF